MKSVAKRNKREIAGLGKFKKYGHEVTNIPDRKNAELMRTVQAGEINLTCNSLRRRKMLVRHDEGNALG